jgi:hypothetical protein
MKNNLLKLSLFGCLLLTGCGSSKVESTQFCNNASINYFYNSTLTSDSKITGSFDGTNESKGYEYYVLSYSTTRPYSAVNSYKETVIKYFYLKDTKTQDFEITLNLDAMFPTKIKEDNIYLVFHGSTWSTSDLTSYSSSELTYSWNNDKVIINLGM